MTKEEFFLILLIWCGLAAVSFVVLLFMPAPYGRHSQKKWGPTINGTLGWFIMEFPSAITYAWFFFIGNNSTNFFSIMFLVMWEIHYLHRALIFPLRRRDTMSPMPLYVVLMGMFFNVINAFLNSYWINELSSGYPEEWFFDITFIIGISLFVIGFLINFNADERLLKLKREGDRGYKIPKGGFYKYISCPNYFGEIMEWIGFAIATWSPAALTFAIWTCANLVPRALSHHKWYQEYFGEYPKERKAIVPFIL